MMLCVRSIHIMICTIFFIFIYILIY